MIPLQIKINEWMNYSVALLQMNNNKKKANNLDTSSPLTSAYLT